MHPDSGGTPAARVAAALRQLSAELSTEQLSVPQDREVAPAPVLCPGPDSPVRFLPLLDKAALSRAGALKRPDGGRWRFIDFAAFEGADFGYAVCRSLLHRLPSEREIETAGSAEGRFRLLLAADQEARESDGPGRLAGQDSAKRLHRLLRASERLRLYPLAALARRLLDARARRTFARYGARIAARRQLLASLAHPHQEGERKPSIVVASFYPVFPFFHGGQRRIFFLSRELSRDHEVTVVTLGRGGQLSYRRFEPNLTVIRVPAEAHYAELERRLLRDEVPFDVTYAQHWHRCRLYQAILGERMRGSSLAICEHPYSLEAIKHARRGRRVPILYNAHNVEIVQKAAMLAEPARTLPLIREMEAAVIAESAKLAVCTGFDRDTFIADYSVPPDKVAVIENGVDCGAVPPVPEQARREYRRRLGLEDRFVALFGGSEYPPNIAAVASILAAAPRLPEVTFLIVGTVCNAPAFQGTLPANVLMLGMLPEPAKWLASIVSDLALNPVTAGSGSNVKMFEYAAAGLPILSTDFGARGTGLRPGEHFHEAAAEDFAERIAALARLDRAALSPIGAAARALVEQTSDWRAIGRRYRALATALIAGG